MFLWDAGIPSFDSVSEFDLNTKRKLAAYY